MSNDLVDLIHVRLREELDRLGLTLAAASRAAGEASPQRLKDVAAGRQKCPAELVARLAATGLDIAYVLTGERANAATSQHLPPDEQLLLDAYRGLTAATRKKLLAELLTGETTKKAAPRRKATDDESVPAVGKIGGSGHRFSIKGDYNEQGKTKK